MEKADYFKHLSKPENGPLTQIVKIIESGISSYEKSIKIMKLLRDECIFIHHNRLHSADFSDATIKPDDVNMKLNLVNEDLVTDWHPIFANSFGPFYPSEYFKRENFRIVWLLKESYIMKDSWVKGDRGKHNQAKEYIDYFEAYGEFGNTTYDNILKLSRTILTTLDVIDENASHKEVLYHICILEVNHFPGLAFNGTDSNDKLIGEWAALNTVLIKLLIKFYAPSVLIGGMTLGHFFPDGYRYDSDNKPENDYGHDSDNKPKKIKNNHNFRHIMSGIKQGIEMLESLGLTCLKGDENIKNTGNYIFKTKENIFLIDAYHPCRAYNYSTTQIKKDADIINQWLNTKK